MPRGLLSVAVRDCKSRPQWGTSSCSLGRLSPKTQRIGTFVCRMWESWNYSKLRHQWQEKGAAALGNSPQLHKKVNIVATWPNSPSRRCYPQKNPHANNRSSTTPNSRKQTRPQCPWADEWLHKLWHTHSTGYYSTVSRTTDIATTGQNLERWCGVMEPVTEDHTLCNSMIWNTQKGLIQSPNVD